MCPGIIPRERGRGKYLSVCSQIPGGTILKNGGIGKEFLVKMTKTLLEEATFEAFRAIHDIGGKSVGEGFSKSGKSTI